MTSRVVFEIETETAYREADEMTDRIHSSTSSLEVFSGDHPTYGRVYIVIPPLGNSVVLPIATQKLVV